MSKLSLIIVGAIGVYIYLISSSRLVRAEDIRVAKTCQVTDPTGTPLNARLQPNGKVVARITNGRSVYPQSISIDPDGKPWALVAIKDRGNYRVLGYVLREFISCY